ncbi:MAG: prepilin-type N-terminal cleavage/methylation domain-containing protein [Polyangiaceae bacterium]|nr:prepilin-type N-terminal cleavage/methylation domain-containing protein [Polyangiaceae bacterium]
MNLTPRPPLPKGRGGAKLRRGVTLLEILVAIGILALVASLVYGAFDGLARARTSLDSSSERFHQGRSALSRMTREVQSAFLSLHRPIQQPGLQVSQTIFKGTDGGRFDRLDFTSFSHRRLGFDTHESDQNELSYFLSPDPSSGKTDLARREASFIDMDPEKGGKVLVLAYDAAMLDFQFYDRETGEWRDSWDSMGAGQLERLPTHVRIELLLNKPGSGEPLRFLTKVPITMKTPLMFGLPI